MTKREPSAPATEGHDEGMATAPAGSWGTLFVTRRCCGTATCRNVAPALFGEVAPDAGAGERRAGTLPVLPGSYEEGAFSGVLRQPRSEEDYVAARAAVAGCSANAIRLSRPARKTAAGAGGSPWREWPQRLEGEVWALGQPAARNFGAMAYFIERAGGGVLIDVPEPSEALFRWLEEHGGVRWLFITHHDHAQHHAEIKARFPQCTRILGEADVKRVGTKYADRTADVEIKLPGTLTPMTLEGAPIADDALASADLIVLPQPGHTPGSLCLAYRGRFLFTGDHLAYSRRLGHVIGHRLQCWQDWEVQTRSVEALASWAASGWLRFAWILPGHGEWRCLDGEGDGGASASEEALRRAVAWMRAQPPGHVPLVRWVFFAISRAEPRGGLARVVRFLGRGRRDAWVLPRAVQRYVPSS